jgi:hypothetical protein
MKYDAHMRAQEMILGADEMSGDDQRWLDEHLSGCAECGVLARHAEAVRSALKSVPIMAEPRMVEAAQMRARLYAMELQERTARRWFIVLASAISVLITAASVPAMWEGARWLATAAGWSPSWTVVVMSGVWFIPTAIAAAAAVALRAAHRENAVPMVNGGRL